MKCFYHNDLDGICAGFWVRHKSMIEGIDKDEQSYLPIDYSKEFPLEEIKPDEKVYIVGFSIDREDMKKLLNITKNVVWIDRGISEISKYEGFIGNISGLHSDSLPACALAFLYLFRNSNLSKHESIPLFTQMIGHYDPHKFKSDDEVQDFIVGMSSIPNLNPTNDIFVDLYMDPMKIADIRRKGTGIIMKNMGKSGKSFHIIRSIV